MAVPDAPGVGPSDPAASGSASGVEVEASGAGLGWRARAGLEARGSCSAGSSRCVGSFVVAAEPEPVPRPRPPLLREREEAGRSAAVVSPSGEDRGLSGFSAMVSVDAADGFASLTAEARRAGWGSLGGFSVLVVALGIGAPRLNAAARSAAAVSVGRSVAGALGVATSVSWSI